MIRDYHLHLYFHAASRTTAVAIHQRLTDQLDFAIEVEPLRDEPVGPHLLPQFRATVLPDAFEAVVGWFMIHHGDHSVLIHPSTGDDLADHTRHALWLGDRVPLDHSRLDPP